MASLLSLLDEMPLSPYHDLGLGLLPHHPVGHYYPSRHLSLRGPGGQLQRKSEGKVNHVGKDGFQVSMDVAQFKPSELLVKVVDGSILIEGNHEEREDEHGYITRRFVRRYTLPKGYDANNVVSTLSSDGVLTVSLPKPAIEDKNNERIVQIQQVGPAHLNVKQNQQEQLDNGGGNGEPAQ